MPAHSPDRGPAHRIVDTAGRRVPGSLAVPLATPLTCGERLPQVCCDTAGRRHWGRGRSSRTAPPPFGGACAARFRRRRGLPWRCHGHRPGLRLSTVQRARRPPISPAPPARRSIRGERKRYDPDPDGSGGSICSYVGSAGRHRLGATTPARGGLGVAGDPPTPRSGARTSAYRRPRGGARVRVEWGRSRHSGEAASLWSCSCRSMRRGREPARRGGAEQRGEPGGVPRPRR